MSEEKKHLTEEERKGLKEELKKKIDEMSDDELEKVAGGMIVYETCPTHKISYNKYWGCPKCYPDRYNYKCEQCGITFSNERELADHIFISHPKDGGTTL